jgi:hypothetical protein
MDLRSMGKLGLRLAPSLEIRPLFHSSNAGSAWTHVVKNSCAINRMMHCCSAALLLRREKRVIF